MTTGTDAIRRVARDFEQRGYTVSLAPLETDGQALEPDFIASRDDEVVLVEVKERGEFRTEDLRRFEDYVRGRPGWRFQLVVARRDERDEPAPSRADSPSDPSRALDEARKLVRVSPGSALVMAFAAIEQAAVATGQTFGAERRPNMRNVLRRAVSKGVISRVEYAQAQSLIERRNGVVHGASEVDHRLAAEAVALAERLTKNLLDQREELHDA